MPREAYFHKFGEFMLPQDVVRKIADPEATLSKFIESTYRIAADLGNWDRDALECPVGEPERGQSGSKKKLKITSKNYR